MNTFTIGLLCGAYVLIGLFSASALWRGFFAPAWSKLPISSCWFVPQPRHCFVMFLLWPLVWGVALVYLLGCIVWFKLFPSRYVEE